MATSDTMSSSSRPGSPLVKFCGITRADDARRASLLGASYVGAIFAESVRRVSAASAAAVFQAAGPGVRRVAVFGEGDARAISDIASSIGADVVQLHGGVKREEIEALRPMFRGEIWAVVPVDPASGVIPKDAEELTGIADAMVFDSRVAGKTGGTGVTIDWSRLADNIAAIRGLTKIILAGGLDSGNVGRAIDAVQPDVVDVSSGVESAPGIKDHRLMRAFAEAVRSASIDREGKPSSSKLEF